MRKQNFDKKGIYAKHNIFTKVLSTCHAEFISASKHLINNKFRIIVTLLVLNVLTLPSSSHGAGKRERFSSSLLQQENSEGGQAGRVFQVPDTVRSMAGEVIKRTFVYRGNPKKAFLLSLLLPGAGQHYVKSRKSVRFFAVMEAALWGTMIGHRLASRWAKENYKAFAIDHALVNVQGKKSQYFVDIGNFMDIYRYNHKKQVYRRDELIYEVTPENIWQWDNDENRRRFRKMRIDADATKNRATYFGAGIMINHIISAIHAALVAKQGNPIEEARKTSNFHVSIFDTPKSDSPLVVASYSRQW